MQAGTQKLRLNNLASVDDQEATVVRFGGIDQGKMTGGHRKEQAREMRLLACISIGGKRKTMMKRKD